jgi:hypothetical protein
VTWLDPAPAIARRLVTVVEGRAVERGESVAFFTSGKPAPEPIVRLLAGRGLVVPMATASECHSRAARSADPRTQIN